MPRQGFLHPGHGRRALEPPARRACAGYRTGTAARRRRRYARAGERPDRRETRGPPPRGSLEGRPALVRARPAATTARADAPVQTCRRGPRLRPTVRRVTVGTEQERHMMVSFAVGNLERDGDLRKEGLERERF